MNNLFKKLCAAVTAVSVMASALVFPAAAADTEEKITLPDNEAINFVNSMGAGWNLGNTFDASDCTWLSDEMDYESAWCGAKTTRELIKAVADEGFTTIRVPVSWHNHVDSSFNISEAWMKRVKEVVDWCVDEDMYVILNSHHDIEKGYYYPTNDEYKTSEKYVKSIWTQIGEEFKDYSEKLIFEVSNEPRAKGADYEWWFDVNSPSEQAAESIECVNKLNQAALDAIRATGGNNKSRYVMIPGYDSSTNGIITDGFKLPKDSVKNRLILTIHIYTNKKGYYINPIKKVYEKYIKNGIPVILGEYNSSEGSNSYTSESAEYLGGLVKYARERGITSVIWDNNAKEFKLIDRATVKWVHKDVADAIVKNGASEVKQTSAKTDKTETKTDDKSAKPVVTAKAGNKKATLTWTAVDGATKYKVYSYKNGKLTALKTTTKLKYTVKSLKNGKKYSYVVKAYVNGKWTSVKKADVVTVTPKKS